jgi:hypothetical protein
VIIYGEVVNGGSNPPIRTNYFLLISLT